MIIPLLGNKIVLLVLQFRNGLYADYTLLPGRTKTRKVKQAFLEAPEIKPTFFDIAKLRQIVIG
jgi:hypothetical protein